MKTIYPIKTTLEKEVLGTSECRFRIGECVTVQGFVQAFRNLGGTAFVGLRDHAGLIQVVVDRASENDGNLREGDIIRVTGECRADARALYGVEISAARIELLRRPVEPLPFSLAKKSLGLNLDTDLENRPISLRHMSHVHRFKLQAALVGGFRQYLEPVRK